MLEVLQKTFDFFSEKTEIKPSIVDKPVGYSGLYGFHKYWGKKPHEPIAYVIEQLTQKGDCVLDPFLGSGIAARESLLRSRSFIGYDINPVAIDISKLLVSPPSCARLREAFKFISKNAKEQINQSYLLEDQERIATHYLWEDDKITKVWITQGRKREEFDPTDYDLNLSQSFADYKSSYIRSPRFFSNSRINASTNMSINDILTGRAQRNIDILLKTIKDCPKEIQPSLRLCLTAASGQISKMVFAVTGRGKTNGEKSTKVEVGSWVIGYWRPKTHFEINVWNCFERRVKKLISALKGGDPLFGTYITNDINELFNKKSDIYINCGDCMQLIQEIPDDSIQLIITDPPHNDRIPYLELSEFWNSILGYDSDFVNEIVISNAKERSKDADTYICTMVNFFRQASRVLKKNGYLVVLYNTTKREEWEIFAPWLGKDHSTCESFPLRYLGHFPCAYSAGSVVQDNRKGSLKTDIALVFDKPCSSIQSQQHFEALSRIPNWSSMSPIC